MRNSKNNNKLKQIEVILYRVKNESLEYLLLKRTKERGGFWQPITGGVKEGEDVLESVRREITEETGVENIVNIINLNYKFNFNKGELSFVEYTFGAEILPQNKIKISYEHDEYKWCDYKKAINLITWNGNKRALVKLNKQLANN